MLTKQTTEKEIKTNVGREKQNPRLKNIIINRIHLPQHSNSYQATGNEANPHHPGTIQKFRLQIGNKMLETLYLVLKINQNNRSN
jgi:hypothetical protein